MRVAVGGRSGPFGAGGVGTGVRLEPVGAHVASFWNVYVDLYGPGPRPTGGQRLAHAGVSGATRAVVTRRGHAKGLDTWTACG